MLFNYSLVSQNTANYYLFQFLSSSSFLLSLENTHYRSNKSYTLYLSESWNTIIRNILHLVQIRVLVYYLSNMLKELIKNTFMLVIVNYLCFFTSY